MYLPRIYALEEFDYRLRYAIRAILRDSIADEALFNNCFEMGDGERIIVAILRRGLKNPKLRIALERSHLINLNLWLARYPEVAMKYQTDDAEK
jgi:hypothetical protein